nr:hypothetical protein [Tanacetum cinerariifolium]
MDAAWSEVGIPLFEYYHTFDALWREFDILVNLPERSYALKKHNDLLKLMQFLMGLDDVYTPIMSQILTTEPLHDVKSAFATLSRDESYRKGQHASSSKNSHDMFTARSNDWKNNKNNGHTIDRCFKLIGYPSGFKKRPGNGQSTGNTAANNAVPARSGCGDYDSAQKSLMRTGSESCRLYFYDMGYPLMYFMRRVLLS